MAENKKYYWLKLQEDFFESEEIKILESMPNGILYSNFYLKLLCKSLKTDGKLIFKDIIPYTPEMLANITGVPVDTVRVAVDVFLKLGMIEKLDSGALYMIAIENMTGCETEWAKKKREYRNSLKESPKKSLENKEKIKKDNVQDEKDNVFFKKDNVRQEIEIEIEKELETEIDIGTKSEHFSQESMKIYFKYLCRRFNQVSINQQSALEITRKCEELDLNPLYEIYKSSFLRGDVKGDVELTLRSFLRLNLYEKMKNGLYRNKQLKNTEENTSTALKMLKELKNGGVENGI